ncbi:helix-turn-helix domain-containing protein [Photorhabdus noenieputensis]|nr:helix-turn-helix domain-containing protein [Photorhabdus noenieputensis]MBS9435882.1 helix-turn-helix domain-containing protein [Photorhabdus noenieputensis]MCK3667554.1 helix-turn-helix domain-containing protein [Photorhabdus noenieputensis]
MSMSLMVKAMSIKVGNPLRKLVLIKLADNANDQGECWPSVAYIAEQCEISERSVQNHIKQLVKDGIVCVTERKTQNGLNQSNVYFLNLDKSSHGYSENVAPYGASLAPSGANSAGVSGAGDAPRTSHPFEPVTEPKTPLTPRKGRREKLKFDPITAKPKNVSDEVWADWVTFRLEIKKPLTETMCKQQEKKLADCTNPDSVICTSIANGWQGLFPEKSQNIKPKFTQNTHTGYEGITYEPQDSYWSENID